MGGLRMINEYVINNKNDPLVQNFRGDMKDWFTNDYNRYQWNVQCEFLNCKRNVYLQKCGILVFLYSSNSIMVLLPEPIINQNMTKEHTGGGPGGKNSWEEEMARFPETITSKTKYF